MIEGNRILSFKMHLTHKKSNSPDKSFQEREMYARLSIHKSRKEVIKNGKEQKKQMGQKGSDNNRNDCDSSFIVSNMDISAL